MKQTAAETATVIRSVVTQASAFQAFTRAMVETTAGIGVMKRTANVMNGSSGVHLRVYALTETECVMATETVLMVATNATVSVPMTKCDVLILHSVFQEVRCVTAQSTVICTQRK